MPWEDWAGVREDLRHSSMPPKPLTPEEEALRDKREAQLLAATVLVLSLLSLWGLLWVLWNFVVPHLAALAALVTFFNQNQIVAGGANILQYLTVSIAVIVWGKAYLRKKKAMKKREE